MEVSDVATQILSIRTQVLPIRSDVIYIGTHRGLILRDVALVGADVAAVRSDVIHIRVDSGVVLRHLCPIRSDSTLISADAGSVCVHRAPVLADLRTIGADGGTRLVDGRVLVSASTLFRVVMMQVALLSAHVRLVFRDSAAVSAHGSPILLNVRLAGLEIGAILREVRAITADVRAVLLDTLLVGADVAFIGAYLGAPLPQVSAVLLDVALISAHILTDCVLVADHTPAIRTGGSAITRDVISRGAAVGPLIVNCSAVVSTIALLPIVTVQALVIAAQVRLVLSDVAPLISQGVLVALHGPLISGGIIVRGGGAGHARCRRGSGSADGGRRRCGLRAYRLRLRIRRGLCLRKSSVRSHDGSYG